MERKLRYLEKEIKKDGIPMLDLGENPDAPLPREMIDLEVTFKKIICRCFIQLNANHSGLFRPRLRNWKMNYEKLIKMPRL